MSGPAVGPGPTAPEASPAPAQPGATTAAPRLSEAARTRPRLGFLGLGWIGRARLEALVGTGVADVAAVADPLDEARDEARELAPEAAEARCLDELLEHDVDGVVIATPSALHAEDATRALQAGRAVFCQKPLGRTQQEVRDVLEAARTADRLLGIDWCYRRTRAAEALRREVRSGALGSVYAIDLTFHNAYGPDKPWFYRRSESGGGCLLDLGTHLVDLALWLLDEPEVREISGALMAGGRPLPRHGETVEDFATAELVLQSGVRARLACSWRLPAGRDAVISAHLWGTEGGAAMLNVDGSFYDFVAERYDGTRREVLVRPPDDWGGRALVAWARRLALDPSHDPSVESVLEVSRVLDRLYLR